MTIDIRAEPTARETEFASLYAQVQQFYADQLQLLDAHDAERWAETFTEDAVFEIPALSEPVRGRNGLISTLRRNQEHQQRDGARLRRWIGMLDVRPQLDGTLHTRCSALVYMTPRGGESKVLHVCAMEDVLVRSRSTWRTRHRRVTRDDLA
ncbi:nuclear transport factor 2 family protein [Streptomyces lunaelactis]|uniref:nuclear transport factor 2 family protein n=1 Tax=Streptomyces lunaelactis TaxID=1535768 RepID=UPI00158585B7|nr:nuclear transport factor 2 family protein [Streptomyces lunaelactis]NUL01692.1 nuclear transport factor 2 family protein [Streptomyces lunaelactis]